MKQSCQHQKQMALTLSGTELNIININCHWQTEWNKCHWHWVAQNAKTNRHWLLRNMRSTAGHQEPWDSPWLLQLWKVVPHSALWRIRDSEGSSSKTIRSSRTVYDGDDEFKNSDNNKVSKGSMTTISLITINDNKFRYSQSIFNDGEFWTWRGKFFGKKFKG